MRTDSQLFPLFWRVTDSLKAFASEQYLALSLKWIFSDTFEVFAQCKGAESYLRSLSLMQSLRCLMRIVTQPKLLCFNARCMAYMWPQSSLSSAPFSINRLSTLSWDKRMATWIGDSLYLFSVSILSLNWSPWQERYRMENRREGRKEHTMKTNLKTTPGYHQRNT